MHRSAAILLLLLPLVDFGLTLANEPLPLKQDQLAEILDTVRTKHKLPALAAAVVNDRGLQLMAAVGVRKHGTQINVTNDDQFHLGSDTKPFTAWLLAWLVERGLIGWDSPLEKVFPELAKDWPADLRKITPLHLLTHHSGLPADFPGSWWVIPAKGTPRDQRLVLMKRLGEVKMALKPGEKYLYSNLGYTVVAAMAERVAKDSWENLLKKNLFDPLKMKTVGHGPMGKENAVLQPWQHYSDGAPVSPKWKNDNPPVMGPAGRLHMSMPDWSKFVAETLRGARGGKGMLKPATYDCMFDSPFKDTFYCVGGWIGKRKNEDGTGLVLGHDGTNTQNYSSALLLPDRNLAVLVATNQGGEPGRKGCHEVRDAMLEKLSRK